jgi:hypothetical protein
MPKEKKPMTGQDLLHHLRNSKGWPTLGNAAADRIEELLSGRERLRKRIEAADRLAAAHDANRSIEEIDRELQAYRATEGQG